MKRYDPTTVHGTFGVFAEMRKNENGDYVQYEDMVRVMDRLAKYFIKADKFRRKFVIEFIKEM